MDKITGTAQTIVRGGLGKYDKMMSETVGDEDKPVIVLNEQQTAYKILREQGLSKQLAAKSVGYSKDYGYQLEGKLRKFKITGNKKLLKSANSALTHIINGQKFGDLKEIKDSTVMSAVNAIYDRHDPMVKQTMNLNLNTDISPVDLSKYRD